jgi:hypothetical protein
MNKSRIFFENTYPVAGKTVTVIQPGQVPTKDTKTAKKGAAGIQSRDEPQRAAVAHRETAKTVHYERHELHERTA